jgi:DNA mismatch repair protein MutH
LKATFDPADRLSIEAAARTLVGSSVRDAMTPAEVATWLPNAANKGDVGHAIEHAFGIARNSVSEPDFMPAGIELKVVPVHHDRGIRCVKERCYLTQVRWADLHTGVAFDESDAHAKTRSLLLVFYEWVKGQDPLDAYILDVALWNMDEIVTDAYREAWDVATQRVQVGIGHQASSGDTPIVGIARKGAGTWAPPDGSPPVPARAWAIKQDYMQRLLRDLTRVQAQVPSPEDYAAKLRRALTPYVGMTAKQIAEDVLGYTGGQGAKHYLHLVLRRLVAHIDDLDPKVALGDLADAGISVRTARLSWTHEQDHPKAAEDLSFPPVPFMRLAETRFENSRIARDLQAIALVVFRVADERSESVYLDTVAWLPSEATRQAAADDYERIQGAVRSSDLRRLPKGDQVRVLRLGTKSTKAVEHRQVLPDGTEEAQRSFYIVGRAYTPELPDLLTPEARSALRRLPE